MWTRKELKDKAKQRCKLNYWKCVLVALLMALLGGGASVGSGSGGTYTGVRNTVDKVFDNDYHDYDDVYDSLDDFDDDVDLYLENWGDRSPAETAVTVTAIFVIVLLVMIIVLVIVMIVVIPLQVFIVNPLEVGINRFFVQNLRENANIKEICYAFDHQYMNSVKTLFFRDLFVFLWSLLFIIPGIIKAYEYRMIPYILGDTPGISREEAFAISSHMMQGNKWNAFVLDLSFLGWYILNGVTLGILGIFYVNPYVNQTNAALYQKLKELQMMAQQHDAHDFCNEILQ